MLLLRKNTAGQRVFFGLVNATSGAAVTGASVTGQRAIDSGAQAAITGTIAEIGNGQYRADLSQADTNGDFIGYLFTATGAVPVSRFARTTNADLLDGVRLGLTALPNANAGAAGGLPTGNASGQVTVASIVTDGVSAAAFSQAAADKVWASATRSLTAAVTVGTINANVITAASLATDAGDEIAAAVWGAAARTLTGSVTVSGSVAVGSIGSGAIDAASIAAAGANKIADHIWRRSIASVEASGDGDAYSVRSPLQALRKLINRVRVNAGALEIYKEDDTTISLSQTLTTNPAAEPIVEANTV